MATVEQAENIEQQVMVNTGRGSVSASVRLAERGVDGFMQAVNALRDALDQRQDERKTARANEPGQVSMSEFKETMRGDREIVALEDTRVADILTTELKRLDVRFAVDSPEPGVQEFHVQGRDAKVLVLGWGSTYGPIGAGCRVCERAGCPQRAFPAIGKALDIDEHRSTISPYLVR